jgi:ERCC4-related helicase
MQQIQAKIIAGFKPFQYQQETVSRCYEILEDVNGCFIMDSTGLGKTITALTLAINSVESPKVLIVAPEKNKLAWLSVLNNCQKIEFHISGFKKIESPIDFNVVIVDEAHNFRTPTAESYVNLWTIIRNRIKIPKVILLSATPFQNTIEQFAATCALIPFNTNTFAYLFLGQIFAKFSKLNKEVAALQQKIKDSWFAVKGGFPDIEKITKSKHRLAEIEPQIEALTQTLVEHLTEFCVRTTRDDITALYPNDHEAIGSFPIVNTTNVEIEVDTETAVLVNMLVNRLKDNDKMPLARYNINRYTDEPNKQSFNGIIKCFLLKRLDSSIDCFVSSIENMLSNNADILKSKTATPFENQFCISIKEQTNVSKYVVNNGFFNDLQKDNIALTELLSQAKKCTSANKMARLVENIKPNEKTIIFTEYADSLSLIESYLKQHTNLRVVTADGTVNDKTLAAIEADFDANHNKPTNNFDVLICTDVMAEGVNLHRATTLIHFDEKWNPQKTIQRNGRINRINRFAKGQKTIQVISLGMAALIESLLEFNSKIETKLSMADLVLSFNHRTIKRQISGFEPNKTYTLKANSNNVEKLDDYICFFLNDGQQQVVKINFMASCRGDNNIITNCISEVRGRTILTTTNGANVDNHKVKLHKNALDNIISKRTLKHNIDTILHNHFAAIDNLHVDYSIINCALNSSILDHYNKELQKEFDLYKEQCDFHNIMQSEKVQKILGLLLNLLNFNRSSDVVYSEMSFEN